MAKGTIRLATRGSPLARLQAELVGSELARIDTRVGFELVIVRTRGDVESSAPLSAIGGTGVFVKEVQQAVLDGAADAAVHSAKDLPSRTPDGLVIACVPRRGDPRDVMVGSSLEELPPGAVVATGSARRRAQLAWMRPDLSFCELRGNIETRIARAEEVGAGVLAMAALERLGLGEHIAEVLDPTRMLPQVGQGALAVECRADDHETFEMLAALEDEKDRRAVSAERSWLDAIGGGCSMPVGAFATAEYELTLEAMVASNDGRIVLRRSATGKDPQEVGTRLAREMVEESGVQAIEGWVDLTGRT